MDEGDLFIQLDVFDEQRIQDEDELTCDDGVDLNNPTQVFNALFVEVCNLRYLPNQGSSFRDLGRGE